MTLAEERLLSKLIHSVGLNNHLRDKDVRDIFESQFRFIYDTIRQSNLENMDPEDMENIKTNFILKHIGKLYTTPGVVRIVNNRKNKNNKEDGEQTS